MPDPNGYLLPNERDFLLRRYAPVMVFFPEEIEHAPYPDEGDAIYTKRGAYHPRSANLFLNHAKLRYHKRYLFQHPSLWFKPRHYQEEIDSLEEAITREDLQAAMEEFHHDPRYTGLGDAEFRGAVRTRLVQRQLAERLKGFDQPLDRDHNIDHWKLYFKHLAEDDPTTTRSVIYGRVVQGLAPLGKDQKPPESAMAQLSNYGPYDVNQTRIALQYWFPYYYDDWANRHEGDWEMITVLVELSPLVIAQAHELAEADLLAGAEVRDVGYASHEDGFRRLWADVQKTKDQHPIVYVARGSQASYFSWQLDGYPTSARVAFVEKVVQLLGRLLRGRRILGRRWDVDVRARFTGRDPKNTDWVAADPVPEDRYDYTNAEPLEKLMPSPCRGVRRQPDFGPDAGLNGSTYHLETQNLFWLEMVQEYGVQWGQSSFWPGSEGPRGLSMADRDRVRSAINSLAQIETHIQQALDQLTQSPFVPSHAIPQLDVLLRPLRPARLEKTDCFPVSVRSYIYTMWDAVLKSHPEAWPGGPGILMRWRLAQQPNPGPLLVRDDPIFHLKSLLASVRRTRYEIQHAGSKWDNPFAWVRHICLADTFYYGVSRSSDPTTLDISRFDCRDTEMSAM